MHKPIYTFLVVKMQLIHAKADLRFFTVQKYAKLHYDSAKISKKCIMTVHFLSLMRLPQQIIHRFYWVECQNRDFDEDGNPVRHGTVPEAGELHGFQVFAVFLLQ